MFKRVISFSVLILFTLWILPLGVFVRPSDEKKFCDGQRAICLCKHLIDKQMAKNAGKILLRSMTASPEKESGSSSGPQFLLADAFSLDKSDQVVALLDEDKIHSFQFIRTIEHIPNFSPSAV
jgi:hypothetical protein